LNFPQHDCQEFLALTLDVLHEQLKTWNSFKKGDESIVTSSSSSKNVQVSSTTNNSDSESLPSPGESKHCIGEDESKILSESLSPQMKRRKLEENSLKDVSMINQEAPIQTPNLVNGHREEIEPSPADRVSNNISLEEQAKLASEFWTNYIKDNNTVIASSFQGMYKSTVSNRIVLSY